MLFQQGALFSALTVKQNVQVPMREFLELSDRLLDELAMLKIEMVGLKPDAADKLPSELSGGMIKRAALARALSLDPDILFLDEPTSGLDPIGAGEFDELIATLQRTLGLTVFMVTHDLDSLHTVCDRIAALGDGKILAEGTIETMLASDHPWLRAYFHGKRARAVMAAGLKVNDGNACELRPDRTVHPCGDRGRVRLRLLVLRRRPRPGPADASAIVFAGSVSGLSQGLHRVLQRPAGRRGDGNQPFAGGSAPGCRRSSRSTAIRRSAPTPARASNIRA